jgi:periplasmic protein TonB
MKRNEKRVPGFDEIIFRNRNKEYGAYDLRRCYKSTASFSTLGVSAFFILITFLISSFMPKDATAGTGPIIFISANPDIYTNPKEVAPPDVKKPANQPELPRYVPPKVVEDPADNSNTMMTNDAASAIIKNGFVTDKRDTLIEAIIPDPVKNEEIFIKVEESPVFPGGDIALLKYIAENTKYPQEAIDINMQGKVIVKFAVMYDGSVSRIEIIRSISPILDQEAARVVSTLPKWKPGKQNGVPVSVWFTVPVTFQIK